MKGKVPFPSTYMVNNFAPWSAYPQFASPVKNGAMPDLITQIYPWKHFTIEQWKKGQIPLWNPYSFSGTPHLANYQSAVLSPVNLLFFVFPFVTAWSLSILLQPLLAGLFMYVYIRSLSISKLGSLLSSISFMFCGFVVTWMDYGTLAYAILFLPLALFAIEKYIKTKRMWFLILLSLSIPFSFFSGHFQTSIYFYLFTAIYAIFVSLREKNWKLLLWIGLYGIFGLLLSMPQILPSLEFYTQSVRSGLFEKVEIIPWAYLPTLIAPDFYGNPVTRNDWFGHYAEWNAYAGLVPLILGLYSIKRLSKQIIFFGVSAIVILLLAFPSPLLNAMVALHIPVLSTSSASRIIVLFSFIIASLAGFGFDLLLKDVEKNIFKPMLILLGGFAGIYCVLWVIVVRKLFLPIDKIVIAKQNMLLPTILFICILLLIAGIYLLRKIIKQKLVIVLFAGLIALVVFDMLRFATKWQPFDPNLLMYPNVPV
ncbi:MAG TPA: YfhO family protein, partial [Patescibacteria group bacterium]